MRIEQLSLSGVSGCRDVRIEFAPGFNVILGGNGSGKTLCLWAVKTVFLGAEASPLKPPPEQGRIAVAVSEGARRVTLERDLGENTVEVAIVSESGSHETVFEGAGTGGAYRRAINLALGWEAIDQWLQFGIVPEGTLGEISGLVGTRSAIDHGKHVLAVLTEARANLVGDSNGHPGEIDVINRELERKQEDLALWEDHAGRFEQLHLRLDGITKSQGEATRGADARANSYDSLIRLQELFAERDTRKEELQTLEAQRERVKNLVEAVDQAEKSLEEEYGEFLNAGTDLEDALQQWSEDTTRMHDIQRNMYLARQALSAAPNVNRTRFALMVAVGLSVLGYLAAWGAGIAQWGLVIGPAMGAIGVAASWVKNRNLAQLARRRKQQLMELEEENHRVEESLEGAKELMGRMGDVGHPMAIRRAVIQYWKAREDVERLRARRDEHPPLVEVVNTCEDVVDALAETEHEIRDLKELAPYLSDFDRQSRTLSGEIDMAKAQSDASLSRAERLSNERAAIFREIEYLCEEAAPLGRLERERKELARRKEQAEQEAKSLAICQEVWKQALEEYRENAQGQLTSAAGKHFAEFTERRYTAVRGRGKALEVQEGGGTWVSAAVLSDGTREQLGMALRLAEASSSPGSLVLDNAFLRWDEGRCKSVRAALQTQVKLGLQVLLFTHNTHLSDWGDTVLSLADATDGESAYPQVA